MGSITDTGSTGTGTSDQHGNVNTTMMPGPVPIRHLLPDALNYLNVIKSRIDARGQGANESIMLDDRGRVVEASIYNIVVVSSRQLRTPSEGCLQGVTLDATFEAAEQLGFAVERSHLYPYDLETADEVILTSTAVGLLPLVSLNGHPIGDGIPGPVFSELNDAYQQALRDPAQGVPTALARDLVSN